jgi:site-specific DNA recombinase
MRAALYVRVSTDRQQHAQTIEQQVTQLRAWVAARDGWTVREEHIFRDDGHSGARLDRPGLDALRDHAARAAFDVVVVCAPDRLARNFVHQMVVLEELERRGVRVVFCDRPLRDDPHEQLVTQIRGAVAEYERTLIADRMRRGRQARLRSGQLLPWTRAPYGYRLHPERPRDPAALQIDPVAAVVVSELFAAYAAGGVTLHTLAAQLTARGVPTPTGRPIWRPTTIRNLLTNPAYKGQAASGRLRTTPARQPKSALEPIGKGMSTTAHPSEEWITVPVPALVSAEQFDLVERRLAANQRSARRSTTHPYLLRGLVSCGVCRLSCSGSPARPPTPGIATTAAWASRRGSAPAVRVAARRGSSPPPSSTSWSGPISARSCSIRSWSPRRWSAPTAAPGCLESSAAGRQACVASGQRGPPASAAAGGLPGRGDRPGLLPAAGPRPCRPGGRPAGPRAGGHR